MKGAAAAAVLCRTQRAAGGCSEGGKRGSQQPAMAAVVRSHIAAAPPQRAGRAHLRGISQPPLVQPRLQHAVLDEHKVCATSPRGMAAHRAAFAAASASQQQQHTRPSTPSAL